MPEAARQLPIVALHTAIIYLFLILALRIVGRRQLGQLNVIDLVIIILLGSAVETAMVAGNTNLYSGLVSATTLFVCNRVLTFVVRRYRRARGVVAGHTALLVNNGQVVEENLRRSGLTQNDLLIAVRARGSADLEEVRYAVLEADGSINVVPFDDSPEPLQSDLSGVIPEKIPPEAQSPAAA